MSTAIQRPAPASGEARSRTYRPAGQRPPCVAGSGRTSAATLRGAIGWAPAGLPDGRGSSSARVTRANVAVSAPSALVRQAVTIRLARPGAPDHVEGAQAPRPAMSDAPSERSGIEESPGCLLYTSPSPRD